MIATLSSVFVAHGNPPVDEKHSMSTEAMSIGAISSRGTCSSDFIVASHSSCECEKRLLSAWRLGGTLNRNHDDGTRFVVSKNMDVTSAFDSHGTQPLTVPMDIARRRVWIVGKKTLMYFSTSRCVGSFADGTHPHIRCASMSAKESCLMRRLSWSSLIRRLRCMVDVYLYVRCGWYPWTRTQVVVPLDDVA